MNATPVNSASRVIIEEPPASTSGALTPDLVNILDVTSILFAMQSEQQHAQEAQHEADIRAHASEVRLALDQVRRAAEEARAQADESSFWGDFVSVAKTVGAVASVAAGVAGGLATGGLTVAGGLALAGALVSVCATPIAEAFGGDENAAFWIGIAGSAVSLGGGAAGILLGGTKEIATAGLRTAARYGEWVGRGVDASGRDGSAGPSTRFPA